MLDWFPPSDEPTSRRYVSSGEWTLKTIHVGALKGDEADETRRGLVGHRRRGKCTIMEWDEVKGNLVNRSGPGNIIKQTDKREGCLVFGVLSSTTEQVTT